MKNPALLVVLIAAGAGVVWWQFRGRSASIGVEEVPMNEFNIGDIPYIAPILNTLEDMGFPVGTPRGIRNNNPGNIDFNTSTKWVGLVGNDGRFCVFDKPENGIRAIQRVLNSYSARGIDTVREVVTTWAPPVENNTAAYVAAVANACGVGADQVPNRMRLIKAIVKHENGQQPYTDFQIANGIALA
jgi:hypothetical protein